MTDEALENTVRADDPETYLRQKALELHSLPPAPRSPNHLGYLTQVYKVGSVQWGELYTDEKLEHPDQYLEWATALAGELPVERILALGYSYSVLNVCCLFILTPGYIRGENMVVRENQPHNEWHLNPVPDRFAHTLWSILRKGA
jgi:hypothetical protein